MPVTPPSSAGCEPSGAATPTRDESVAEAPSANSEGAKWTGPPCLMCNGTGKDRDARAPGGRCRACLGHGRDAE